MDADAALTGTGTVTGFAGAGACFIVSVQIDTRRVDVPADERSVQVAADDRTVEVPYGA